MSIQTDIVKAPDYESLLDSIDSLWGQARARAVNAVNTELLEANWETGRYIVEFEQKGNLRAEYGANLLSNLSRDLTIRRGKGFSRSNLTYMRKLYVMFPKRETLSHKLTWSHYFELLMEYALQGITNQLFVAKYQLYLPHKEELQQQLDRILAEESHNID